MTAACAPPTPRQGGDSPGTCTTSRWSAPSLNRYEKRAKDAAEWLPEMNRCWFANRVIEIRRADSLSIDRREARSLDAVIASCDSLDLSDVPAGDSLSRSPNGTGSRGPMWPLQELHGVTDGSSFQCTERSLRLPKSDGPRQGWMGLRAIDQLQTHCSRPKRIRHGSGLQSRWAEACYFPVLVCRRGVNGWPVTDPLGSWNMRLLSCNICSKENPARISGSTFQAARWLARMARARPSEDICRRSKGFQELRCPYA